MKALGYIRNVIIWYVKHEHELGILKELKDDNDAIALVKIALWRFIKQAHIFVLNGFKNGKGVILTNFIIKVLSGEVVDEGNAKNVVDETNAENAMDEINA